MLLQFFYIMSEHLMAAAGNFTMRLYRGKTAPYQPRGHENVAYRTSHVLIV